MNKQKIAILGGGQLGKMICQAGSKLSLDISILDPSPKPPASLICTNVTQGDFNNYDDVIHFAGQAEIVTIEIENVSTNALEALEKQGKIVYPQSRIIKLIKDKGLQKQFYENKGMPSAPFGIYNDKSSIQEDKEKGQLSFPFVQKLRTGGYDGRGVQVIRGENDMEKLFELPSVVEKLVDIQKELSVVVARNAKGEIKTYPVVEMEFNAEANLVEFLFCPANISTKIEEDAAQLAIKIAEELKIVGILAVELFLDQHNEILVNEIAPRTHNSGHHTIEANYTSQFEQQLRAILNLPLGSTNLTTSAAVMINLLGEAGYVGPAKYEGLEACLELEGCFIHIYGKETTKPFRKMGHATVIGKDLNDAVKKARFVQEHLKIIS